MSDASTSSNITILDAPLNGKCYLVGTAHFSLESQKEVSDLIQRVKPNFVVLELCSSRSNILHLDEETVLNEAKEMNISKILKLIKESSLAHGLLQALLVNMYAKVTKELGIAPGGEFRVAYKEALKINGCRVILGDMPIKLTLRRGFNSLPWYKKLKLAWTLFTTDHKLTKEDIEELKRSDILDNLVKEFGTSFPEFKTVLIDERDLYLTHSLQKACKPIPNEFKVGGFTPACVVGVVGLGHSNGIKKNWNKEIDISPFMEIKEIRKYNKSYGIYFKYGLLIGVLSVVCYQTLNRK